MENNNNNNNSTGIKISLEKNVFKITYIVLYYV